MIAWHLHLLEADGGEKIAWSEEGAFDQAGQKEPLSWGTSALPQLKLGLCFIIPSARFRHLAN
jgi:hypothetical protein